MAKARTGEFPVAGDRVLAEDGSVWVCTGDDVWTQQEPALSMAELDDAQANEKALIDRLSVDHRVYALAFGAVRMVKRERDLTEGDPKEAFVLALAEASLRDSIVAVCSEDHVRSDLEARAFTRFRSFLGDPEIAGARSALEELRRRIADESTPDGVAAKARGPLDELAELAGKLPPSSDARTTISAIVSSRKPLPELADKLFRELVTQGIALDIAQAAHGAASAVARAYG